MKEFPMRTISDDIGRGPINSSYIGDENGKGANWGTRRTVGRKHFDPLAGSLRDPSAIPPDEPYPDDEPKPVVEQVEINSPLSRRKLQSVGTCGFITSCYPRARTLDAEQRQLLAALPAKQPIAANDNTYSGRWPVREEYIAGRLGVSATQNENSWEAVEYIAQVWNNFCESAEPYFSPGSVRYTGAGRTQMLGDMTLLRGQERYAHISGLWRRLDERTEGRFILVKKAVVDGCEMRALAGDMLKIPIAKRAAVGRVRLIEALPLVAEEIRLLDLANAA
jgi:hypothetical protein